MFFTFLSISHCSIFLHMFLVQIAVIHHTAIFSQTSTFFTIFLYLITSHMSVCYV